MTNDDETSQHLPDAGAHRGGRAVLFEGNGQGQTALAVGHQQPLVDERLQTRDDGAVAAVRVRSGEGGKAMPVRDAVAGFVEGTVRAG